MAEYIEKGQLVKDLLLLADVETGIRQQAILGCASTIQNRKAADVAPVRHGRWIYHAETIHTLAHTRCSVCSSIRYEHYVNDFRFCPSCGARMDGGGDG